MLTTALLTAAATTTVLSAATTAAAASPATPDLGPNVTVFDPGMPVGDIQATLDAAHAAQVDNEMGTTRHAYLFKPGTYGTAEQPLQIKVGYYTEIAGLGASPRTSSSTARSRSTTAAWRTAAPATASRSSTSGAPCRTCRSTSTPQARTAAGLRRTSGPSRRPCPCAGSTSAAAPCR
ncbi:hypothetical protein ACFQQB_29660 [Nonomuraea rubra]|uniref:hypothetical protein n=1 Tax=Nonomuraea rubra TaxID=46180 RepID=UPI00360739C0